MIAIYVKYDKGDGRVLTVYHWGSVPSYGDHIRVKDGGTVILAEVIDAVWSGSPRECNVDLYVRKVN